MTANAVYKCLDPIDTHIHTTTSCRRMYKGFS